MIKRYCSVLLVSFFLLIQAGLLSAGALDDAVRRGVLKVGPAGLNNSERLALLSDPVALARLHEQVWSEGHAEWLGAWRASIKADPHAPLLPLQPQSPQAQPA